MTNILQIGFGPLGIQIAKYIAAKSTLKTQAVVDLNPALRGQTLNAIDALLSVDVVIKSSISEALEPSSKPAVALITTVSDLKRLIPQVRAIAEFGIPVVSTCEELSYPWILQPELSKELDDLCREKGIACLGTGVNPGFLMDYLPAVLTSICKNIDHIKVERIQDASPRRLPFQKKIGAGLSLKAFKAKEKEGVLRHVGLQESLYLLAQSAGLTLDNVTETLEPVIALNDIFTKTMTIKKGEARGVEQIAKGYQNGVCQLELHFKAAMGEARSYDKITIKGTPSFSSEIEGGINGDVATCAMTINSIKSVLKASPGLHTMADVALPGFIN